MFPERQRTRLQQQGERHPAMLSDTLPLQGLTDESCCGAWQQWRRAVAHAQSQRDVQVERISGGGMQRPDQGSKMPPQSRVQAEWGSDWTFSKFISHFVWKKKKDQDINFHLNSSRVCVPSSSPAVFRHVYLSLVWHCPADLSANLTCLPSFLFSSVNSAHLIWQCWAFAPFALNLLFFTKDNHLSSAPLLPYSFGSVPEAAS